jgi:hypothetical protein
VNLTAKGAAFHRLTFYDRDLAANDAFPHDVYGRRKEVVLHIDLIGGRGKRLCFIQMSLYHQEVTYFILRN